MTQVFFRANGAILRLQGKHARVCGRAQHAHTEHNKQGRAVQPLMVPHRLVQVHERPDKDNRQYGSQDKEPGNPLCMILVILLWHRSIVARVLQS